MGAGRGVHDLLLLLLLLGGVVYHIILNLNYYNRLMEDKITVAGLTRV